MSRLQKHSLDWPDEEAGEEEDRILVGFDRIERRSVTHRRQDQAKKWAKYLGIAAAVAIAIGLVIGITVGTVKHSQQPWTCPQPAGSYNLTFFVIGDWGRQGNAHQREAALMMADVAGCMPPAFIISTGDNFYDSGLRSATDPQFDKSWRSVYSAPSLQVPWYAVLGNHDYGNGVDPDSNSACAARQLSACPQGCCYSSIWQYTGQANDARWHCQNGTYTVPAGPLADIVMMDTNPEIKRYLKEGWANNAAGIASQDPEATAAGVLGSLKASAAPWKLVVGHHPIRSYGQHCDYDNQEDCLDMDKWRTRLQDAGAHVYFCGHEHDLQYIAPDMTSAQLSFVVSGAGSDVRHNEFTMRTDWPAELRFVADDQGFVAVRVNETALVLHFYASSKVVPSYTRTITK